MEKGYLIVQTYVSRESFGVADTVITLSDGRRLVTDENGFTQSIDVDAPDKILSESPGAVNPFTLLDMTLEKEGYFTIELKNVQVFSGETTLQKVQMLPVPENGGGGTITYDFTQQNL
ncbi:MAG: hypothetical protein IJE10_07725 [Clostridia bacterium]|nr:hypothetical protein [Clostridia bacterium]